MIPRLLNLNHYNNSFFLFGPRQTGKTFLIKNTLQADLSINLLKAQERRRFQRDPGLLAQELKFLGQGPKLIVVDEIQYCPELLHEIQDLIETYPQYRFVMTGSSARKLRQGGINLLGGRALTLQLYPFTFTECQDYCQLQHCLEYGSLPRVVLTQSPQQKRRLLNSYVETYLKEEIQQEALTRNVVAFTQFLELAAFDNGQLLNFSNLARDVGVDAKTIKAYYQILEDTLLGFYLYPYTRSHRDKLLRHPKFYFFDPGVLRALKQCLKASLIPASPDYGFAFEHWILLEVKRLMDYREREASMYFFRTSDGAEVDLVLEREGQTWAVEIKAKPQVKASELRSLRRFVSDHPVDRQICVSLSPRPYLLGDIEVLPWQDFLEQV